MLNHNGTMRYCGIRQFVSFFQKEIYVTVRYDSFDMHVLFVLVLGLNTGVK